MKYNIKEYLRTQKVEQRGAWKQYAVGCAASLSYWAAASCYGWINPVLPWLLSRDSTVPTSITQAALMASLPELGSVLLALPGGLLADFLGRRTALLASTPLFLITLTITYFTTSATVVVINRFLQGALIGLVTSVLPIYLGEISDANLRGGVCSLSLVFWALGQVYILIGGLYVTYRTSIIMCAVPLLLFLLAFWWCPETPHHLARRGDLEAVKKSLACLRGGDVSVEAASLQWTPSTLWSLEVLTGAKLLKGLLIVVVTTTAVGAGGTMVVLTLSTELGSTCRPAFSRASTYAAASTSLLASVLSPYLVHTLCRRTVLFLCFLLNTLSMSFPLVYHVSTLFFTELSLCPYAVFCTDLAPAIFSLGAYSIARIYQAELFTTTTRGFASGFATVVFGVSSAASVQLFQMLIGSTYFFVNYAVFVLISVFSFVFVLVLVPETKDKTFDQIQDLL